MKVWKIAAVTLLLVAALVVGALRALNANLAAAGEAGTVQDLRSVGSSEASYASVNGGAYGKLECLAGPRNCGFPADTSPFLDSHVASLNGAKNGYALSFLAGAPAKGKPDPGIQGFVLVAIPLKVENANKKGLAIDHTGLLCYTRDGTAPPIVNGALAPACTPLK